jgi:GntR family transcriptional repressor for pyruvate dehydrogenase complex
MERRVGLAGEALLRPVRTGNAFEDTVGRLLQLIRLGMVEPGLALPSERDLALSFGVSRDTVRDAIRALAEAGFLVSRRGRYGGTFVSDALPERGLSAVLDGQPGALAKPAATATEIEDSLVLREILEVGTARAAAARTLTSAQREVLWDSLMATKNASAADYRRLDSRLHLAIGEAVGIASLIPLLADNRTRINDLLDEIPLLAQNIAHSNDQHEAIVAAILAGDTDRAAEAMHEHLAGSAALLRGFLA